MLWASVACGPLGFLAIEAGWVVTEVGRQPWVVYGIVRTADAVTPVMGLNVPFAGVTFVYLVSSMLDEGAVFTRPWFPMLPRRAQRRKRFALAAGRGARGADHVCWLRSNGFLVYSGGMDMMLISRPRYQLGPASA